MYPMLPALSLAVLWNMNQPSYMVLEMDRKNLSQTKFWSWQLTEFFCRLNGLVLLLLSMKYYYDTLS